MPSRRNGRYVDRCASSMEAYHRHTANALASSDESISKAAVDEKFVCDVSSLENATGKGGYKAAFPNIDERALMRKIDLRVVPFIFILNFFTFLDR